MTRGPRTEAAAFAHFNAGRFAEALAAFRRLAGSGIRDPRIECFMGHCLSSLGRSAEARRGWLALWRKDPGHLPVYCALAQAALKEGRPLEASDRLFQALKIRPAAARDEGPFRDLLSGTAYALFNACRFAEALKAFRRLEKPGRLDPGLACLAGHCLASLGRRAEAERLWKKLARGRGYAPALLGLAQAALEDGRAQAAERYLLKGLAREPGNARAKGRLRDLYRTMAVRLRDLGKSREAEAMWFRARALAPEGFSGILELVHRLRERGDMKRAQALSRREGQGAGEELRREALEFEAFWLLRAQHARGAGQGLRAEAIMRAQIHSPFLACPEGAALRREVLGELGALLRGRAAAEQAAGRWRAAGDTLSESVRLGPGDGAEELQLWETLVQRGRAAAARAVLARARRKVPDTDEGRIREFRILMGLGRHAEAFSRAEALLRRPPSPAVSAALAWPWGNVYPDLAGARRVMAGPLARLEAAAGKRTGFPWAGFYAVVLRRSMGLPPRAGPFLPAGSRLGARYRWMLLEEGRVRLEAEDFSGAIENLKRSLKGPKPADWKAFAFLGEAYACLGKRAACLSAFSRGAARAPAAEKSGALAWKGLMHLWFGEFRAALKVLSRAVDGEGRYAFCWRGAALLRLGKIREALKDFDRALELKAWDLEAWNWRAEAKRLSRDCSGALKDLERAAAISPDDPWMRINRALVMNARGEFSRMRREFFRLDSALVSYLRVRLKAPPGPLSDRDILRLLKGALKLNHGNRRALGYQARAWMR